jgi:preprotein translocase subunit SecB
VSDDNKQVAMQGPEVRAGFRINRLFFVEQSQKVTAPTKEMPKGQRPVKLLWDWRKASERVFEVKVGVEVGPVQEAPETLVVHLVARFSLIGPPVDDEKLRQYATINAVGILLPYTREALTALSVRGSCGPFYLEPLNVVELMRRYDRSRATGAREEATPEQRSRAKPTREEKKR